MPTYRDQQLACESCGKTFFFTVTEQRRMEQEGGEIVTPGLCRACRSQDPATGKQRGRIKWFKPQKGYGFVRTEAGDELFFHQTRTLEPDLSNLKEGTEVIFSVEDTPKGSEATQVELAAADDQGRISSEREGSGDGVDVTSEF